MNHLHDGASFYYKLKHTTRFFRQFSKQKASEYRKVDSTQEPN